MPRGNGTGPMGMGPMTGCGAGYCAGFGVPGYAGYGGRGFSGRGFGFRHRCFTGGFAGWGSAPPYHFVGLTPEEERRALTRQASRYEEELAGLKKRISELESEKPEAGE